MWVRIKKGQLQGRNLLAKDVKYKANLEKILKSDIGYIDFKLVLKLDMLVEIYACNYDSQDGLVNGADGILKAYTKTKKLMSSGLSSMTRILATEEKDVEMVLARV
jgi:hypothetical protein